MQSIDAEKAAQIWKRVRSQAPDPHSSAAMQAMITEERTDAVIYLTLSRTLPGRNGVLLRQMSEQEQSHIACLKGIYALITGEKAAMPRIFPPAQSPEITLRSCYGREMRSLAAYESRSSDPEYGPVFAHMALQEQEHCRKLLEIIGSLKP